MSQFRLARISLLIAAIGLNTAPALLGMVPTAQADETAPAAAPKEDTVRPEMFKLVDPAAVKELMAAKNYQEVQSRIDQVAALPNLTPYETFVLNRLRISLGSATQNTALTVAGLEAVIDSGRLPKEEQGNFILALGTSYYDSKDYPKAIAALERYQKETGDTAKARPYIIRSYYFQNDFARAKTELLASIEAMQAAGTAPSLADLQLLANSANKVKDDATYRTAVELLVKNYPSDEYWQKLLYPLKNKNMESNKLQLDIYRLENTAIARMEADEYVDMAELALLQGQPNEAKKVMEAGYAKGILGSGANAAKQKKVRDQASKTAAEDLKGLAAGEASAAKTKDGTGLLNLGYSYVTMDQFDKGIDLIQKGIAKGLKLPQEGTLRLGVAYAMAGRKDEAIKTFDSIQGKDANADLARFWTLWLNRPATPAASDTAAPAAAK